MRPVLFEIPLPWGSSLPLHGYGLMIVLGFLLSAWLMTRETRRRGLPDVMYDLGLAMLLSGLLGGRILYYVKNYQEQYSHESFLEFFKIWKGGLVFYGGAITGLLGGLLYCWRKKLPTLDLMDVAAMGAPIAMAFGRLGCFLNGCCYGMLCEPDFTLGVVFPPGSPASQEQRSLGLLHGTSSLPLAVHPTQLYQAAHDFLLGGLLFWYLRRSDAPRGAGMPILFSLYAVGRFALERLRGDNLSTFTGFTLSQNLSLALLPVFGGAFFALFQRARRAMKAAERNLRNTH